MVEKILRWVVIALAVGFTVIQLIQPDRSNPPTDQAMVIEAKLNFRAPISTMLKASCYDCHSNETRWPWYSNVAPVSWLVADDVHTGRRHLNFSEWGKYPKSKQILKLGQIYEQVSKGDMPIVKYLYMHSDAKLSQANRDSITAWTEAMRDSVMEEK